MSKLRVTIVGAGKIGALRAQTAKVHPKSELCKIVDLDAIRARQLAERMKCEYSNDWESAVTSESSDIIVVSATNNALAEIAQRAVANGKHVLVEKPGATRYKDMKKLAERAKESRVKAKIGFNHRFHPGIAALRELYDNNHLGKITFIRARHGHGGRVGYEKEWRANPAISGGGEMLDQGVHSLDIMNWFIGGFDRAAAWTSTCFWNMPVEDNVLAMLSSSAEASASLNVTWTQWKPIFSFEVYGTNGFAEVNGLGGAYGQETLNYGDSKGEKVNKITYSQVDNSWTLEWEHFVRAIEDEKEPMSSAQESLRIMEEVEAIYRSAKNGSKVESLKLE
ncbi:MAG: Gfo/Idh/MocA family protein [Nitrososphaerales archaeon]